MVAFEKRSEGCWRRSKTHSRQLPLRVDCDKLGRSARAVIHHRCWILSVGRDWVVAKWYAQSVSLLVRSQLIGRVHIEPFEHGLNPVWNNVASYRHSKSNIVGRSLLEHIEQRRKSVRVTPWAPMLIKEQDAIPAPQLCEC